MSLQSRCLLVASKKCIYEDHEGNRWLPLSAFHKSAKSPDGHHSYCKKCVPVYNRKLKAQKKQGSKHCSRGKNCEHPDGPMLLLSEFNKESSASDGLRSECRECQKADRRRYSENGTQTQVQIDLLAELEKKGAKISALEIKNKSLSEQLADEKAARQSCDRRLYLELKRQVKLIKRLELSHPGDQIKIFQEEYERLGVS